jgi:hypothetical protein
LKSSGNRPSRAERPIFVLCVGRSGSTLLRFLLDASDEVACPPETNLCTVFGTIDGLLARLANGEGQSVDELCRFIADATLGSYARERGKSRWADKSLPSVDHADLLHRVYPEAKFICLFRQCLDTVGSLLEASPYGFGNFGLEPYVARFPDNLMVAAACLWADKVTQMLEFADAHSHSCYRLRYEDLVSAPGEVMPTLFSFLDVPWSDDFLDPNRLFSRHPADEPGDFKLRYTKEIHESSVGRGALLPATMLPPPVLERIDQLGAQLGYPAIRDGHGPKREATRKPRLLKRFSADTRLTNGVEASSVGTDHSLEALLKGRVATRLAARQPGAVKATRIRLDLVDEASPWIIDLTRHTIEQVDGDAEFVIWSDRATLLEIASGSCNPGVAIRKSRIRVGSPAEVTPSLSQEDWDHVDAVIDLIAP